MRWLYKWLASVSMAAYVHCMKRLGIRVLYQEGICVERSPAMFISNQSEKGEAN